MPDGLKIWSVAEVIAYAERLGMIASHAVGMGEGYGCGYLFTYSRGRKRCASTTQAVNWLQGFEDGRNSAIQIINGGRKGADTQASDQGN